ncbi:hypothetical protein ACFQ2B_33495 [Streptomyces stramineus]
MVRAAPRRWAPKLVGLAAVAALVAGVVVLTDRGGHSSSADAPPPSASPSRSGPATPFDSSVPTGLPTRSAPTPHLPVPPLPSLPPPAPVSPYDSGTCLDGEAATRATTAVSVDPFRVVSCSSSKARYRVIRTFHGTSDLSRCQSVADTQYSYSSRSTRGGVTLWEVVYCLVGVGSHAG